MSELSKGPEVLSRLNDARVRREQGEAEFAAAVRAAMEQREGLTVGAIADAAGITRVRAYQIADGRR